MKEFREKNILLESYCTFTIVSTDDDDNEDIQCTMDTII